MAIAAAEWLEYVDREYLSAFVPGGGAAVKFAIGDPATLSALRAGLSRSARSRSLAYMDLDAAVTRVHMIQDLFFEIARQVDWYGQSQRLVERMFARHHYQWPNPGATASFIEIAAMNRVDDTILRRDFNQWVTAEIGSRPSLASSFRNAAIQLCRSRLERSAGDVAPQDDPVVQWLRGDLKKMSSVTASGIASKINRHNARSMLKSLCSWLRLAGTDGLILVLDIRQLLRDIPPPAGDARRYGPAAVLDAYEVLRQMIDDAERFEGLFLVVVADDALLDRDRNPRRSVQNYTALHMRIASDVQAATRSNPLAPLVELGERPLEGAAR